MSCNHVQGLFSEIYDGVAENNAGLIKHLHECPVCGAEYEQFKQLFDEVRQLPEPDFPCFFHELSMRNIAEHVPPTDHVIDELIEEINMRERLRNKKRKRTRTAAQATTRWAGVAVAACLLLVSAFALRAFDLPARRTTTYDFAPAAVAEMAEYEDEVMMFDAVADEDFHLWTDMYGYADEETVPGDLFTSRDDMAVSGREYRGTDFDIGEADFDDARQNMIISEEQEDITEYGVMAVPVPDSLPAGAPPQAGTEAYGDACDFDFTFGAEAESADENAVETAPMRPIGAYAQAENDTAGDFDMPLTGGGEMSLSGGSSSLWPVVIAILVGVVVPLCAAFAIYIYKKKG